MKNYRTELLAPAGDLEKAYLALEYGADAVFVGGKSYSLRAHASNFEIQDIKKICDFAHQKNKKVYIVTNIICHNHLLKQANDYLKQLISCNPDGFITADPYIVDLLHKNFPEQEIHISTQQSICNSKAALFWKRNFATRVVLAREVTFDELQLLMRNLQNKIEIEIFIHGAVCISYSGRCTMSNNFSLRDANVGGCAQSCRWKYHIENQEIRNKNNYFTMSAKDMVQIDHLNRLLDLGIDSLKIEGRMKSLHYIATVVNAYSKAIDRYYKKANNNNDDLRDELLNAANRETDTAWFDGEPNYQKMLYHDIEKKVTQNYAFIIEKAVDNGYLIITKNKIQVNDTIEIISPRFDQKIITKITKLKNQQGFEIDVCPTPMSEIYIEFNTNEKFNYPDIGRLI